MHMRIVLLGAPGAGKGTQAQFIVKKYGIPKIATGDLLRALVKSDAKLGKEVQNSINKGKLVSDKLVINLFKERIIQQDCCNGFLLDGFPRNILQAYAIKEAGISIDYVIKLDVPDGLIIDRIIGRRIHVKSGRIYHIKFNPPKINKESIINKDLITRTDDKEEIVRQRLIEYHRVTVPMINFYTKEAQSGRIKFLQLNGAKSIDEVHAELEKILS